MLEKAKVCKYSALKARGRVRLLFTQKYATLLVPVPVQLCFNRCKKVVYKKEKPVHEATSDMQVSLCMFLDCVSSALLLLNTSDRVGFSWMGEAKCVNTLEHFLLRSICGVNNCQEQCTAFLRGLHLSCLPARVVNSSSVAVLKRNLDKRRCNEDIYHNYKATTTGSGSRSIVMWNYVIDKL